MAFNMMYSDEKVLLMGSQPSSSTSEPIRVDDIDIHIVGIRIPRRIPSIRKPRVVVECEQSIQCRAWGCRVLTKRDSIYVDGEKYYIMERIREDSIRTYEKVQKASSGSGMEYVLQKKKIIYPHETENYYREISHPNILKLVSVDRRGGNILIVYPEMKNNRNLDSYLQSENINSLDKVKQVFSIFRGVCNAIEYLSDMDRVYTALCTENIMLIANNKPLLRDITYIEPGSTSQLVDQVRNLGRMLGKISNNISWDDWRLEQYEYLCDEINTKVFEFTNAKENGPFVHNIIIYVSEIINM